MTFSFKDNTKAIVFTATEHRLSANRVAQISMFASFRGKTCAGANFAVEVGYLSTTGCSGLIYSSLIKLDLRIVLPQTILHNYLGNSYNRRYVNDKQTLLCFY